MNTTASGSPTTYEQRWRHLVIRITPPGLERNRSSAEGESWHWGPYALPRMRVRAVSECAWSPNPINEIYQNP